MPRVRRRYDSVPGRARPGEDGSASLEFVTVGLLLLVPLVYLALALASIQGGALAVEGAARQAARVFVEAPDEATARSRATAAVAVALADFGLPPQTARLDVGCRPDAGGCLRRGGVVTVTVGALVPLPLLPDVAGLRSSASVPV